MRIVSPDIEWTRPQLEGAFKCGLHACELTTSCEGPEVVDPSLELAAGIDSGKTLFPIYLHEREVSKRLHPSIGFRERPPSFEI
jgi:hypothetical protein